MLICPNCRKRLVKAENRYVCESGHSFDIARQGYVNLLMKSGATVHGDNAEMIKARQEFLDKGYYGGLRSAICKVVLSHIRDGGVFLDAGCGDMWYSQEIIKRADSINAYGTDISKDAVKRASARKTGAVLAVASNAEIPLESKSVDVILSVFAPLYEEETLRILKNDGVIVKVTPMQRHLLSLKEILYENVRIKDESAFFTSFDEIYSEEYFEIITVEGDDIYRLYTMTPYSHKTSAQDGEKLKAISSLKTEIHCKISVYKPHGFDN